uniref:ARAD1B05170p n=1 Tax=Blastobotrys adeninivorans TaxID=409370 RepID=A0A060T5L1_BLAAD
MAPPIEVVALVLADKNGKDKSIKLIQYCGKLALWTLKKRQIECPQFTRPCSAMVSNFSLFRNIMRLGDWLDACIATEELLAKVSSQKGKLDSKDVRKLIVAMADFWNTINDDIYTTWKMGVHRSKGMASMAEIQASYGWIIAIVLNLLTEWEKYQELKVKMQLATSKVQEKQGHDQTIKGLHNSLHMSRLNMLKLTFDGLFCLIDVFQLDIDPIFQILTGMGSGIIGYYKVYQKMR